MPPRIKALLALSRAHEVSDMLSKVGRKAATEEHLRLSPLEHPSTAGTIQAWMEATRPMADELRQATDISPVSTLGGPVEAQVQRPGAHQGVLDKLQRLSEQVSPEQYAQSITGYKDLNLDQWVPGFFESIKNVKTGQVEPPSPGTVMSALDQALSLVKPETVEGDVGSTLNRGRRTFLAGQEADEFVNWRNAQEQMSPEDVTAEATLQQTPKPRSGGHVFASRKEQQAARAQFAEAQAGPIASQPGGVPGLLPVGAAEERPIELLRSGKRRAHLLRLTDEAGTDLMVDDGSGTMIPLRDAIKRPGAQMDFSDPSGDTHTMDIGPHRILDQLGVYSQEDRDKLYKKSPGRHPGDFIPSNKKGKAKPSDRWILQLADYLGLPPAQLHEILINAQEPTRLKPGETRPAAYAAVWGRKGPPPKRGLVPWPAGWTPQRAADILSSPAGHSVEDLQQARTLLGVRPKTSPMTIVREIKAEFPKITREELLAKYQERQALEAEDLPKKIARALRVQTHLPGAPLPEPPLANVITGGSQGKKPLVATVGGAAEATPTSALPIAGGKPLVVTLPDGRQVKVANVQSPHYSETEVQRSAGRGGSSVASSGASPIQFEEKPSDLFIANQKKAYERANRKRVEAGKPPLPPLTDEEILETFRTLQARKPIPGGQGKKSSLYERSFSETLTHDPVQTQQILTLERQTGRPIEEMVAEVQAQHPEMKQLEAFQEVLKRQQLEQPGTAVRQLYPNDDQILPLSKAGWQFLPRAKQSVKEAGGTFRTQGMPEIEPGVFLVGVNPKTGMGMVTSKVAGPLREVPLHDLPKEASRWIRPEGLSIWTGLSDWNRGVRGEGIETMAHEGAQQHGFHTGWGFALQDDAKVSGHRKVGTLPSGDPDLFPPLKDKAGRIIYDKKTGKPLLGRPLVNKARDRFNVSDSDASLFLTTLTKGDSPSHKVENRRTAEGFRDEHIGGSVQAAWKEASRHQKPSQVINLWPEKPLTSEELKAKAEEAARWVLLGRYRHLNIKGIETSQLSLNPKVRASQLAVAKEFFGHFYEALKGTVPEKPPGPPAGRAQRQPVESFPQISEAAFKQKSAAEAAVLAQEPGRQSGQLPAHGAPDVASSVLEANPDKRQDLVDMATRIVQKRRDLEDRLAAGDLPPETSARLEEHLRDVDRQFAELRESGLLDLVNIRKTEPGTILEGIGHLPEPKSPPPPGAPIPGDFALEARVRGAVQPPEAGQPMATPMEQLFGKRGVQHDLDAIINQPRPLTEVQQQHVDKLTTLMQTAQEVLERDPERFHAAGWSERLRALLTKAGPTVVTAIAGLGGIAKWLATGEDESEEPGRPKISAAGANIKLGPIFKALFGAGKTAAHEVEGELGELSRRRKAPIREVEPTSPGAIAKLQTDWLDSAAPLKRPSEQFEAGGGILPDEANPSIMVPTALGGALGPAHLAGERLRPIIDQIAKLDLMPEFTAILDAESIGRADDSTLRASIQKGKEATRLRLLGRTKEARALEKELYILQQNLKNQTTGPMGISPEAAQANIASIKSRLSADEVQLIEQAQAGMHAENQKLVDAAYDNGEGIISKQLHDTLMDRGFYTPLSYIKGQYRPESDEFLRSRLSRMQEAKMKQDGKGVLSVGEQSLIKELQGAGDALAVSRDPFEAWSKYLETGYSEVGRNRAARSIVWQGDHIPGLKATPENPGGHIIPLRSDEAAPDGFSPMSYFSEGVAQRHAVPVEWGDALQVSTENSVAPGMRTLGKVQALMQMSATSGNLAFIPKNLLKDFQDTLMLLPGLKGGDVGAYATLWQKHLREVLAGTISPVREEFTRAGGDLAGLSKQMDPGEFARGNPRARSANPFKKIIGKSQVALNATEQASKLASYEFLRNLDQTLHQGESMSPIRSAALARKFGGSPDFAVRGAKVPAAAKFVSFFNPQIQGTARTIETIRKNPTKMLRLMAGMTMGFAALDQYNRSFKIEQPDGSTTDAIADVPESDLQNNVVILMPGKPQVGRDGRLHQPSIRIPLGHAAKLLYVPIQDSFRYAHGDPSFNPVETATSSVGSLLPGNLKYDPQNPILGTAQSVVSGLNPLIKVPIEQLADRNTFTDSPIVGSRLSKIRPYSLQYNAQTSPFAKAVGGAMGHLPGGGGWLASPERLEAATRGFVPGVGEMGLSAADAITRLIGGSKEPAETVMTTGERINRSPLSAVLRPFIGRTGSQERDDLSDPIYAALDDSQGRIAAVNHLLKTGDREAATALAMQPETRWALAANSTLQGLAKQLGEIATAKDAIRKSGRPPQEIQTLLQQLAQQEQARLLLGQRVLQSRP